MSYNTECELIDYASRIEEGSTSSDSCKLEDIVNGVSDLIPTELLTEFDEANEEDKQYIFEDIFDHLNEIVPDGLMFGASEGDGACYGFWKTEEI
jgi:hypothetical protein